MGVSVLEGTINTLGQIILKEFNDVELSKQVNRIASSCNEASYAGAEGWSDLHPANIRIASIHQELREKYLGGN
ncbi:MAG: hypothetical protein VX794_04360 [Nitrospinota bacterium]|nr:hypothetical protein [Nitrospinota bacterium]